jgi:hypothetical protein
MNRSHPNTQDDLMFLFGIRKNGKSERTIAIEAENAWLDGKNADANPYPKDSGQHFEWYRFWYQCNKNS